MKKAHDMANQLDYVPLPEKLVKLVKKTWTNSIQDNGKPCGRASSPPVLRI
jgi:hypothetical protein